MRPSICLLVLVPILSAQPEAFRPSGVAKLDGTIHAMAADSIGNLFVVGSTESLQFATLNASQPNMGDSPLMRSNDLGATWTKIPYSVPFLQSITAHPTDPNILFGFSSTAIHRTRDGGQSWQTVFSLGASIVVGQVAIDPAEPRYVYALGTDSGVALFLASNDGGDTWQQSTDRSILFYTSNNHPLWVDPLGSGTIGIGSALSYDHGGHWSSASQGFIWTVPDPGHPRGLFGIKQSGSIVNLFYSDNWGSNWVDRMLGEFGSVTLLNGLLFDPDTPSIIYGVSGIKPLVSRDSGITWSYFTTRYERGTILSKKCNGGAIAVADEYRFGISRDSGLTFQFTALTGIADLTSGPGCALYLTRRPTSDAFVSKFSPTGDLLWSTFLGGTEADSAVALVLDAQGGVYVAGNTSSSDFPKTQPKLGPPHAGGGFLTKFDSDGKLLYSTMFGGESGDLVTGLAVSVSGEPHVTGWTTSNGFPTTANAFQPAASADGSDGFALKFDSNGNLIYGTYLKGFSVVPIGVLSLPLPAKRSTVAVALEAGGTALVGGSAGNFGRLSTDGGSLTLLAKQPGDISSMTADNQGNVFVAGQYSGPEAISKSCFRYFVYQVPYYAPPSDLYVAKLTGELLQQVYFTHLGGACGSAVSTMSLDSAGRVMVGGGIPSGGFPMVNAVSQIPSFVLFQLDADGAVQFSSYAGLTTPAVSWGLASSIYTTGTGNALGVPSESNIFRIPLRPATGLLVKNASNAFSGTGAVAPGVMLRIEGANFSDETIDLGLADADALPTTLGGLQVFIDDVPAEMFRVAPDHLICIVPQAQFTANSARIQVVKGSETATTFAMSKFGTLGLLTSAFPDLPDAQSQGVARNDDATLNSPENPASVGSIVTLFATGLGHPVGNGTTVPLLLNYSSAVTRFPPPGNYVVATVRAMPGFVSGIAALDLKAQPPAGAQSNFFWVTGQQVRIYVK